MADLSIPPGEGILKVARALGRLMAAQQIKAERQLLEIARAGVGSQGDETPPIRAPEPGDKVTLNRVTYRYGSTEYADHFTRLEGDQHEEALVSLRRDSAEARWVIERLAQRSSWGSQSASKPARRAWKERTAGAPSITC